MSVIDDLEQLRQLSESGDIVEGGMVAMEAKLMGGFEQVEREVGQRHASTWPDQAEIRSRIDGMSEEQRREQWAQTRETVVRDAVQALIAYNEMMLTSQGAAPIGDALIGLAITLHNPVVQESLLIPVREGWDGEYRGLFRQIGRLIYGWQRGVIGEPDERTLEYLEHAAERWDMEPDELFEGIWGEPPSAYGIQMGD